MTSASPLYDAALGTASAELVGLVWLAMNPAPV